MRFADCRRNVTIEKVERISTLAQRLSGRVQLESYRIAIEESRLGIHTNVYRDLVQEATESGWTEFHLDRYVGKERYDERITIDDRGTDSS